MKDRTSKSLADELAALPVFAGLDRKAVTAGRVRPVVPSHSHRRA